MSTTINFSKLKSTASVIKANEKLLVQARDRVRKYNKRYGTDYKIPAIDLTDPTIHESLLQITTKNLKAGTVPPLLKRRYEVNGINLTESEYKQMRALENKANKIHGPRDDGTKWYRANFTTYRGYEKYVATLKKRSTYEGYLEAHMYQLQIFRENILDHLYELELSAEDEDMLNRIRDARRWAERSLNTYSRLDKFYKFLKKSGFTPAQMARIFFESDQNRRGFQNGEDIEFIALIEEFRKVGMYDKDGKQIRKQGIYEGKGKITDLEREQPLVITDNIANFSQKVKL